MVGLALQRRARGLPASVIDIGMVIGVGVIQRTENTHGVSAMETALRKLDYMAVSERDLHHILAEAILAGRSDGSPEIITGLEMHKPVSSNSPFWHRNARFAHLISSPESDTGKRSGNSVQRSLKERLVEARKTSDGLQILENAFLAYLASSLKVNQALR